MLVVLLWSAAVIWCLFLVQTVINFSRARRLPGYKPAPREAWPRVSIVVPARNEEKNIRNAVTSFLTQDYPDFEVIVVDDRSEDSTPEILASLKDRFPGLRIVPGKDPPDGWLGKPHALDLGLKASSGQIILFVDADVEYEPSLLKKSVAFLEEEQADMMFVAPEFTTGGVMEAVLMSTLYVVGGVMMPTYLITSSRFKRIAAGGGVFNMVRREVLEAIAAFDCLKDAVVDDVGLGYRVKGAGFHLTGAMAGNLIRIRMYDGGWDTVKGFTKNIYPLLKKIPWLIPLPFFLGSLVNLFPYAGLVLSFQDPRCLLPSLVSLCLMHLVMVILTLSFHQPWYVIFLNPVRELGWWFIILRSFLVYRRKGLVWRGRTYPG